MNAAPMFFRCMDRQSAGLDLPDEVLGRSVVPNDIITWTDNWLIWKVETTYLPTQQECLITVKEDCARRRR